MPLALKLRSYALITRMNKPIGILLLLWPTLWALYIASHGHPQPKLLFIFILGVILMRSAGCIINDFADRNFDGHVERTKARPLVTGQLTSKEALCLFAILTISAFMLAINLNLLSILLAIPAILLATSYPFMKRITQLPQLVLGVAFSWGIPMAFAAATDEVAPIAWLIMLANMLWTIAYDTEYAMVDRKDDIKIGIRSTAILFGSYDRLVIAILQVITLGCFVLIGIKLNFKLIYYLTLAVAGLTFIYQQYLIRNHNPMKCFKAFLNNNWAGLLIFVGILLNYSVQ